MTQKDVVMVLRVTSIIEELTCSEGSLLFPLIRREHRKTNHKERHSSKRKLEEIELHKQEVSTYSKCDAGTRDHG